jgi:hypothetical protein
MEALKAQETERKKRRTLIEVGSSDSPGRAVTPVNSAAADGASNSTAAADDVAAVSTSGSNSACSSPKEPRTRLPLSRSSELSALIQRKFGSGSKRKVCMVAVMGQHTND